MTQPVEFDVDDHRGARIDAGDQDQAQKPAEDAGAPLPVGGWQADEVGAWLSAWWNVACPLFGPKWAANPAEFSAITPGLCPHFDEWFPKGSGTGSSLIPLALAALGTGVTMVVRRSEVIKKHARKPWLVEQLELEQLRRAHAAKPAGSSEPEAAAGEPAPAGPVATGGTSYRMPRDLVRVVDGRSSSSEDAYPGMLK